MHRLIFTTIFSLLLVLGYGQKLGGLLKKAEELVTGESSLDVAGGLKEALNVGVGEAVDFLSVEDGYLESIYKIEIPEEAQSVIKVVKKVPGFENIESELVEKINRAAEDAASKATPIFVDAITGMTFEDATNILMGEDDAATVYLKDQTFQSLYDAFLPVIQSSLDKVNAREYWKSAVTAYNKVPLVKKTNPELDDYVNQKALVGMFSLIEKKEKGIRTDVNQRSSDLLKEVFGKQD